MSEDAVGTPTPASEIMERGVSAEATLPGHVALTATRMVADGMFQNMNELILLAVTTYLDLKRHPDVMRFLDGRLIEEALDAPAYGIPPNQAFAEIMRKLKRSEPMPASEAVRALRNAPVGRTRRLVEPEAA